MMAGRQRFRGRGVRSQPRVPIGPQAARLRSSGTSETVSRSMPRSTSSATLLPILSPVSARIRSSAPVMAFAVEAEHDVARFEAGTVGGAAGLHRCDHHRAWLIELGRVAQPRRHRGLLRGDTDEGAAHAAVADQFAEHEACGVGGDRKADALRAHDHRGVDADDLAARRHQRSARIAGIERGVGLDQVVDQAAACCDRSERPSAETTPVVTVDSKPSGLPMAITNWPRLRLLELPSGAAGRVTGWSTRISARSVSGSSPTSRA